MNSGETQDGENNAAMLEKLKNMPYEILESKSV